MKNSDEEQAVNLPANEESFNSEDPMQVCNTFRARMVCFISDIEKLIRNPSVKEDLGYLDKIAADIVALETLSTCTGCCRENIVEAGKLIHNVITDEIEIKANGFTTTSTLELAKGYRKDKSTAKVFSIMLENYLKDTDVTDTFIKQLKVLAFDIDRDY